tara:strand:- start:1493 stop:2008 length:516 start_codon:yes stop_codon:yes gene_type:complete
MEKRINTKLEHYVQNFKKNICEKVNTIYKEASEDKAELLGFIYDYDRFCLSKEDFIKRKRIKNAIPTSNRCNAKRANGEQCTRRRKENCEYCGTHEKGRPHGLITVTENEENNVKKLEVFAQEIMGIVYYLDKHNNVYNTEDIMNELKNPKIIAKYQIKNDKYCIPELGLI